MLCYALTTPEQDHAKENVATVQPRMLDAKVIDKELATDPTIKELKQLVEGGASEDVGDWPQGLIEYFVKHTYYTVLDNTVLMDGKAIVPGRMRGQMLSALYRSHGGFKGRHVLANNEQ